MSRIRYSEVLGSALYFGFQPKRWLPFFIWDVVVLSLVSVFLYSKPATLQQGLVGLLGSDFTSSSFSLLFVFLVWGLLRLVITGALIYQSASRVSFGESFSYAVRRFPTLLGLTIVLFVITMLLSIIPLIGLPLSLAFGIAFFFYGQSVMLHKDFGVRRAFWDAWDRFWVHRTPFRKNIHKLPFQLWLIIVVLGLLLSITFGFVIGLTGALFSWIFFILFGYLDLYSRVFRIWLVTAVLSSLIIALFTLPYVITLLYTHAQTPELFFSSNIVFLSLGFLNAHVESFMATVVLGLVGFAIASAFVAKSQTEFYRQLRRKRFFSD